jgi:hypothetical protein
LASGTTIGIRRIMGKRSGHSFKKRTRELKRKKKAKEKMERRQSKKEQDAEVEGIDSDRNME